MEAWARPFARAHVWVRAPSCAKSGALINSDSKEVTLSSLEMMQFYNIFKLYVLKCMLRILLFFCFLNVFASFCMIVISDTFSRPVSEIPD